MGNSIKFLIAALLIGPGASLIAEGQLQEVRNLYLDLVKKVVLNTIYEPMIAKENGTEWPNIAHSMIGAKRMDNVRFCCEDVINNDILGDFIETGVWRGGCVIFMRAVLKAYGITDRSVWVADSFEGVPPGNPMEYPRDIGPVADLYMLDWLKVSVEQVKENFKAYDLLDEKVHFLKGFFKDTMPHNSIPNLAILRLDGDLYESTMVVLDHLYDKVSIGGYIIIDDYDLYTANQAVHDFREKRKIDSPLIPIDKNGVYWKKTI